MTFLAFIQWFFPWLDYWYIAWRAYFISSFEIPLLFWNMCQAERKGLKMHSNFLGPLTPPFSQKTFWIFSTILRNESIVSFSNAENQWFLYIWQRNWDFGKFSEKGGVALNQNFRPFSLIKRELWNWIAEMNDRSVSCTFK